MFMKAFPRDLGWVTKVENPKSPSKDSVYFWSNESLKLVSDWNKSGVTTRMIKRGMGLTRALQVRAELNPERYTPPPSNFASLLKTLCQTKGIGGKDDKDDESYASKGMEIGTQVRADFGKEGWWNGKITRQSRNYTDITVTWSDGSNQTFTRQAASLLVAQYADWSSTRAEGTKNSKKRPLTAATTNTSTTASTAFDSVMGSLISSSEALQEESDDLKDKLLRLERENEDLKGELAEQRKRQCTTASTYGEGEYGEIERLKGEIESYKEKIKQQSETIETLGQIVTSQAKS
ncbi:hypothetical protein TrST_g4738 [Triparma strigata]|uniref:Uncharacterized protein n=1 Tax=Triparma strigata TaxID=1606541 RepID=A0A9W7B2M3_9STRA|nr:hypothetical protein TrST_g4738 [Triparma strigata]